MVEDEFNEIGHCGGHFKITVITDEDGRRKYQLSFSHSRPTPASFFAIYALPQGIPVDTIQLEGMGVQWNPPPTSDCFSIFIASDNQSCFGHTCPKCLNYWRSDGVPSHWPMTCPYCGLRTKTHQFLTEGQLKYVEACCKFFNEALDSPDDGTYSINMDEVADAVGKKTKKPKFYYAEESQQNKFTCNACGNFNDILGKYGYCSSCGTRNDLQELEEKIIPSIRNKIKKGGSFEACVKDVVSAFDSFAGKYLEQLVNRIPMTPARKKTFSKMRFHNLEKVSDELKSAFDIKIFKEINLKEIEFSILMFHRRHIYEHKGGEADEKYIKDSGDASVRPKQELKETKVSSEKITDLVVKMGQNLHEGFHSIFPPEKMPITYHEKRYRNTQ